MTEEADKTWDWMLFKVDSPGQITNIAIRVFLWVTLANDLYKLIFPFVKGLLAWPT